MPGFGPYGDAITKVRELEKGKECIRMVEDNLDGGKDVEFSLQCAEFEISVRHPSVDEK